jgi:hypothetical protein
MSFGGAWFCPPLTRQPVTPAGVKKSFFVPRFPPAPSPPRGVKGSLNSQFGFFGPDGGVRAGGCGVGLLAQMGKPGGRSQWIGTWFGCTSERVCASARCAQMRVQGERSERAHAAPLAIGRAEQRSGARIRLGACLSEASLRPAPGGASSARNPAGARPLARLSFAYFSLARQRKVRRPTGRNRYSNLRPAGQNLH